MFDFFCEKFLPDSHGGVAAKSRLSQKPVMRVIAVALALAAFAVQDAALAASPSAKASGALTSEASSGKPTLGKMPARPSEVSSGWAVTCSNNGKDLDCRLVDTITDRNNGRAFMRVVIRSVSAGQYSLMLQLPLGMRVYQPVSLSVDSGKAINMPLDACTPAGCFGQVSLSKTMLASMRAGKELHVAFKNIQNKTLKISLPLAGFTIAFQKAW